MGVPNSCLQSVSVMLELAIFGTDHVFHCSLLDPRIGSPAHRENPALPPFSRRSPALSVQHILETAGGQYPFGPRQQGLLVCLLNAAEHLLGQDAEFQLQLT